MSKDYHETRLKFDAFRELLIFKPMGEQMLIRTSRV